ncbi:MAG: sortase [Bacillales bacterium]|jgi:sortase A|nr:sortase [Bacillales bacterium]
MFNNNLIIRILALLLITIGVISTYRGVRPLFFSKIETIEENKKETKEIKGNNNTDESNKVKDAVDSLSLNQDLSPIIANKNEVVGKLTIPKLKKKMAILEGTSEDVLSNGVGHFSDSALPGENNNVVLSGHRDTVFRNLGKLKIGDQLIVETSDGVFTYKIFQTKIVDKDDRTIIIPTPKEILTLTTCYPFNFIGDAPERYIVSANLLEKTMN